MFCKICLVTLICGCGGFGGGGSCGGIPTCVGGSSSIIWACGSSCASWMSSSALSSCIGSGCVFVGSVGAGWGWFGSNLLLGTRLQSSA